ncbi:hypothetical protein A2U01_0061217, partial [Trifolium medium]|nr:hypothetical protein [Trifolium medium]
SYHWPPPHNRLVYRSYTRVHLTPSRFVVAGEDGCDLVVESDGRAGEDGGEMAGEDCNTPN